MEKKEAEKLALSMINLKFEKHYQNYGNISYNRIEKDFACDGFASFFCDYLGAAPMFYVLATILYLPHPVGQNKACKKEHNPFTEN